MSIPPVVSGPKNLPFTRAVGTARMATEFLTAAKSQDLKKSPPSLVAHFLFGHALELAFKSVLIVHGTTEKVLRELGHDLSQARDQVLAVATPEVIAIDDLDSERIGLLSGYYEAKALEYVEPGFMRLPNLEELSQTTERLVRRILAHVEVRVRKDLRTGRTV